MMLSYMAVIRDFIVIATHNMFDIPYHMYNNKYMYNIEEGLK